MTGKAKKAPKAKAPAPKAEDSERRTLHPHEVVLFPSVKAAAVMDSYGKFAGTIDLSELVQGVRDRIEKVQGGDMRGVEAMLYGQAIALETMFTSLAKRAQAQEYLKQFQAYTTLALKAQAQSRATLEALAEVKNPRPVAFVKQANIAQGPQQVNNGPLPTPANPRAEESATAQNGLLPAPEPVPPVNLTMEPAELVHTLPNGRRRDP